VAVISVSVVVRHSSCGNSHSCYNEGTGVLAERISDLRKLRTIYYTSFIFIHNQTRRSGLNRVSLSPVDSTVVPSDIYSNRRSIPVSTVRHVSFSVRRTRSCRSCFHLPLTLLCSSRLFQPTTVFRHHIETPIHFLTSSPRVRTTIEISQRRFDGAQHAYEQHLLYARPLVRR
jgi:hypothetical protein